MIRTVDEVLRDVTAELGSPEDWPPAARQALRALAAEVAFAELQAAIARRRVHQVEKAMRETESRERLRPAVLGTMPARR